MADLLSTSQNATGALSLLGNSISAIRNIIVVTPSTTIGYQPENQTNSGFSLQNLLQPPNKSLVFNYEGEQTVSLEADITDHYIETNTTIQDHIALRPEMITTHGYIGELNDVPPPALAALQQAANKLGAINSYTPGLSAAAIAAYNTAFQAYQAATAIYNAGSSVVGSVLGSGESVVGPNGLQLASSQNKQQTMFQTFYGYYTQRVLFTVQTPWAVFQNMAIYKLRAIQGEDTTMITDFEVTFKRIRYGTTTSSPSTVKSSIAQYQSALTTQLGSQATSNISDVSSALSKFGG